MWRSRAPSVTASARPNSIRRREFRLEAQPDTYAQQPLALRASRTRDLRVTVQVPDRTIWIQLQARPVRAGEAELRPIEHIERLDAQLQRSVSVERDSSGEPDIPLGDPGATHRVELCRAEARFGRRDGRKC